MSFCVTDAKQQRKHCKYLLIYSVYLSKQFEILQVQQFFLLLHPGDAFLFQTCRPVLRRAGEPQSDRRGQRFPGLPILRRQVAVCRTHHQPEGRGRSRLGLILLLIWMRTNKCNQFYNLQLHTCSFEAVRAAAYSFLSLTNLKVKSNDQSAVLKPSTKWRNASKYIIYI